MLRDRRKSYKKDEVNVAEHGDSLLYYESEKVKAPTWFQGVLTREPSLTPKVHPYSFLYVR